MRASASFPLNNISKKFARPFLFGALLLLSLLLTYYGWWWLQIARGDDAWRRGEYTVAAQRYARAERPLAAAPWLARLLEGDYAHLVFRQAGLLYARRQDDEVVDKLEQAAQTAPMLAQDPEYVPQYAFWSGNVFLRRAIHHPDPEAMMKDLQAALGWYQKGVEAAPDDWDLKYNYELVKRILAEKDRDRKKEDAKVKSILERIRTIMEPAPKELPPPEKRG